MNQEIVSALLTFLGGAAGVKIIEFILARLMAGNNGATRVITASARYVEMTQARLETLEKRNAELEEKYDALRNENEVLIERLNNMDKLYSELGQRLQGEITLRKHLESENERLTTRVNELEAEIHRLQAQLGMA